MATKETTRRRRRSERNSSHYDDETMEFIQAVDAYRRRFNRSFPALSELLSVLKALGYRKVAMPEPFLPEGRAVEAVEPVEPRD